MRHLVLLGTGGTIATRTAPQGRRVDVGAGELLAAAARVWEVPEAAVEVRDVRRITSFSAGVPDVLALARAVRAAAAGADGVVVTHGTDTLEESAFLLALAHGGPVPVVVTGAQRPFDDPAPDGPRNLAAALRWAAAPESDGTGVTVVFADAVLPAVGVRKTHTLELAAFAAPGRGPIGHVDEAGVRRHHTAAPPAPLLDAAADDLPRVAVVPQYLGADASDIEHAVRRGARGVVVAGLGAGNTPPPVTAACLDLLAAGVPVMLTSRVGAGPVVGLYAGGGADLAAAGAILAGDLSPWQGRLLLAAALAAGAAEPSSTAATVAERCRTWLRAAGAVDGTHHLLAGGSAPSQTKGT
ncbi:asparaginase domain-containing protein [Marinitenerispora sediminis]|uniref:asparaginase n=1 Tax=Marinitenerispora sediminis TaxID=1931232 RepID=A0A368TC08_9ACTN|nr:asparaginase domain-containing protein [Marinitenerispora sediminis]RCV50093.1 L-asparaginase [Marinitenerispora sediminis]RCV54462.1 L-asparaginase [Marinitenerispora sediminis]RCV62481.1 L-asparaginase [Marinitenerispora sediminis]